MTINPNTDLVLRPYLRSPKSSNIGFWADSEFQRIEQALREVLEAVPQVADQAPVSPRKGTIRYAVSPWAPGGGTDKWVFWNGTAWVNL